MTPPITKTSNPGNPSYKGWDYQKQVSAFLLIDVLVVEKWAESIILEPDTHEDAEATGDAPHTKASSAQCAGDLPAAADEKAGARAEASGTTVKLTLDVQVKRRANFIWTPSNLRDVLQSGSGKHKEPALKRLKADPKRHWLLVTNAPVNPQLARHEVASWRPVCDRKVVFADSKLQVHNNLAPRVSIVGEFDATKSSQELLRERCRMPEARREACLVALRQLVEDCWLGERPNEVSRQEVLQIIERHGGCRPERVRPDFIRPNAMAAALQSAQESGVVVLVAGPGMGKSTVAEQLAIELAIEDPKLDITVVDDPFGGWQADSEAASAAQTLLGWAAARRSGVVRVVATRPEWLEAAYANQVPKAVRDRCVLFTPDSYERNDRWSLLFGQLPESGWKRAWATKRRKAIEASLAEPMAFHLYGASLVDCGREDQQEHKAWLADAQAQNVHLHVHRLVMDTGSRTPIADALILYLGMSSAETRPWTRQNDRRRPLRRPARQLQSLLKVSGEPSNPMRLARLLLAAGRLDGDAEAANAHPEVLRGLKNVLDTDPDRTEDLVGGIVSGAESPEAHIFLSTFLSELRKLLPDGSLHAFAEEVSLFLEQELLESRNRPAEFRTALGRLARHGTMATPVRSLARALHDPEYKPGRWFNRGFRRFTPPHWSEAVVSAVANSADARKVARGFILSGAVDSFRFGDGALARLFGDLGWGPALAPAFQQALDESPYTTAPRDMMLGALESSSGDLDAAFLQALTDLESLIEDHRETWQHENDGSNLAHDRSDEFAHHEARVLSIVEKARVTMGWTWITEHTHVDQLVDSWAFLLQEATGWVRASASHAPPDDEELDALWALRSHSPERVAEALVAARGGEAGPALIADLLSTVNPTFFARARASVRGLFALGEDGEVGAKLLSSVNASLTLVQRAVLTHVLRDPPPSRFADTRKRAQQFLLAFQTVPEALWCRQVGRTFREEVWGPWQADCPERPKPEPSQDVLTELAHTACPPLAAEAILCLAVEGVAPQVEDCERAWLTGTSACRVLVVSACGVLGTEALLDFVKTHGLPDGDYEVRTRAVQVLDAHGQHLDQLLALGDDKSGPVRAAVASATQRHKIPGDRQVLLKLAIDPWNSDEDVVHGAGPTCAVARVAIRALAGRPPVEATEKGPLIARLNEGIRSHESENEWDVDDWGYMEELQDLLGRSQGSSR